MMSISCGIQAGFTLNFPEEPETAQENIREIGPHVMFAPPRIYEQMVRNVQVKYLDATWAKRKMYEWAMEIGYRVADMKFSKKPVPWDWKVLISCLSGRPEKIEGPSGPLADPTHLHRRGGHGAGPFPLLPCHRRKPEADLRPDGDRGHLRPPPGRGHQIRHGGQAYS